MRELAGAGALLIDPMNEADIGQGLARFFDDPELRNALAAQASKLGHTHSWSRTAQLTLKVLSNAGVTGAGMPAQPKR